MWALALLLAIKPVERVMGIEPTSSAWKAEVLPLNYTRHSASSLLFTAFGRHLRTCRTAPPKREPDALASAQEASHSALNPALHAVFRTCKNPDSPEQQTVRIQLTCLSYTDLSVPVCSVSRPKSSVNPTTLSVKAS